MSVNEDQPLNVVSNDGGGDTNNRQQQRRPGQATESKVLNIVKKNAEEQQLAASVQAGSGPIQPSLEKETVLTLPVIATSNLSATALEFVPMAKGNSYGGGYHYPLDDFNSLSLNDNGEDTNGGTIMSRFNSALYTLNYSPGNIEEYLRPICNTIQSTNTETNEPEKMMKDMVEALFDQSIKEPNFRYTGARICQYLSVNLRHNTYFSNFHKVLMRRCQQDYEKREELLNGSESDQSRLRGLAMFMAEIFLNVEIESADGSVARLDYLPKVLIDFIHTLLSHPVEGEIKCCCQMLKLSGALIEDQAKLKPELCSQFEDIFTLLGQLKTRDELSQNTKILAGTVIVLKEQGWNRSTSSPPKKGFSNSSEGPSFQANWLKQEPTFYNAMGASVPRGQASTGEGEAEDGAYILTEEEERAFMAWQQEEGLVTEEDAYTLDDPEELGMGDEVEAAYEEFLQQQEVADYRPSSIGRGQHHGNPPMQHYPGHPAYQGPGNPYVYNAQHRTPAPHQNYQSYPSQGGGGFAPMQPQQYPRTPYQHPTHQHPSQPQHHQQNQQQQQRYQHPNQMSNAQQQQQAPYNNNPYYQHQQQQQQQHRHNKPY